MDEKPRRRWFRFSLTSLFVLIAVLGVWLGLVTNQVRERRAALAELRAQGVIIFTAGDWSKVAAVSGHPIPTIPRVRRWLGDEAIQSFQFLPSHKPFEAEQRRLAELFPEALITFARLGPPAFQVL